MLIKLISPDNFHYHEIKAIPTRNFTIALKGLCPFVNLNSKVCIWATLINFFGIGVREEVNGWMFLLGVQQTGIPSTEITGWFQTQTQYTTTFHRWINNNIIILTSCLPCHLLAWYSGFETVVLPQCLLPNIDNIYHKLQDVNNLKCSLKFCYS